MHPTFISLPAIGRVLLALIFVLSGIGKLGAIAATSAHMASAGIPYANDLVWGAVALELGGGILLIVGLLTRLIGLAFFFYTLTLAVMFHAYWTMNGAAAHSAILDFLRTHRHHGRDALRRCVRRRSLQHRRNDLGSEAGSIGSVAAAASATSRVGR